jgi:hypothetical protein
MKLRIRKTRYLLAPAASTVPRDIRALHIAYTHVTTGRLMLLEVVVVGQTFDDKFCKEANFSMIFLHIYFHHISFYGRDDSKLIYPLLQTKNPPCFHIILPFKSLHQDFFAGMRVINYVQKICSKIVYHRL